MEDPRAELELTRDAPIDPGLESTYRVVEKENKAAFISNKARITEDDFICKKCINWHQDTQRNLFYPVCELTCQIRQREADVRGEYEGFDPEDVTFLKAMENPVAFAKMMFDWEARPYQQEMMLCTAQQKVVRAGRRIGKSEALIMIMLWLMFNNEGFEIIVICPYERQVELLFEAMRKFIFRSEIYSDAILKDRKDPQEITLKNMAKATGFTAGVKTGEKAAKVRGQGANALFLDEADYLDEGSIEALMALFVDNADVKVWASSTPTGRREMFWRWCTEPQLGFKQFHYTSRVSPNWTARTELFYRSIYSTAGFQHEFLAEFGEAEFAVFKAEHLDASLRDFYYSDIPGPRTANTKDGPKRCIYTFGVDWNSTGTGVHIVVVEYNPQDYKFRTVYKEVVDPKEFTQIKAVERIVKLNDFWHPKWIYVDQGFGEMQVEELHQWGRQYPGSKLHRIVKAINMSTKAEIRDPSSGAIIKKDTKTLMVEMAARRIEDGQCIFARIEDTKKGLVHQLRNYEVIRIAESGKPIYTRENEHTAIAWMLSIFAMMMEFTGLTQVSSSTKTAVAAIFGELPDKDGGRRKHQIPQRTKNMETMYKGRDLGDHYIKRPQLSGRNRPRTLKDLRTRFRPTGRGEF